MWLSDRIDYGAINRLNSWNQNHVYGVSVVCSLNILQDQCRKPLFWK